MTEAVNIEATGAGIRCISRHNDQDEINRMQGIAKLLDRYGFPVNALFIDSKCGLWCAQLIVHDAALANEVAECIEGWLLQFYGGHGGILVRFNDRELAFAEAVYRSDEASRGE